MRNRMNGKMNSYSYLEKMAILYIYIYFFYFVFYCREQSLERREVNGSSNWKFIHILQWFRTWFFFYFFKFNSFYSFYKIKKNTQSFKNKTRKRDINIYFIMSYKGWVIYTLIALPCESSGISSNSTLIQNFSPKNAIIHNDIIITIQ